MEWADLHCDTPLAILRERASLSRNSLHLDLERSKIFSPFLQCAALFCPPAVKDEDGFDYILNMATCFLAEVQKSPEAMQVCNETQRQFARSHGKRGFLLTVEDARILCHDMERIRLLYDLGVRIVTPLWKGESLIGGAHNTSKGLTDLGKKAVETMLNYGIQPDVSHASTASFDEIAAFCEGADRPILATHSCAFSLCRHTRNLSDVQIRRIACSGGVIGINFYPAFLCESGNAAIEDLFCHIRHIIKIGGSDIAALGTDFDGVDRLPRGICGMESMGELPEMMKKYGFTTEEIEKVFFKNADRILKQILKKGDNQ